jgi:hypothetical protein
MGLQLAAPYHLRDADRSVQERSMDQDETKSAMKPAEPRATRAVYEAPALRRIGSVRDLTLSSGATTTDGPGTLGKNKIRL